MPWTLRPTGPGFGGRSGCKPMFAHSTLSFVSLMRSRPNWARLACWSKRPVGLIEPIVSITDEDWHWVMDVNFYGVVNGVKTFLPVCWPGVARGIS